MPLSDNINNVITRIGTEFKTVRTEIANAGGGDLLAANNLSDLANLGTARGNLNVYSEAQVDAAVATAVALRLLTANNLSDLPDVAAARTNLNVYSEAEVDANVNAAIATIIDGSPAALDTLNEIAAALNDNPNQIGEILTALGLRLRFDIAQTLSAAQRTQGQANLNVVDAADIGNTETNFVTVFETALT